MVLLLVSSPYVGACVSYSRDGLVAQPLDIVCVHKACLRWHLVTSNIVVGRKERKSKASRGQPSAGEAMSNAHVTGTLRSEGDLAATRTDFDRSSTLSLSLSFSLSHFHSIVCPCTQRPESICPMVVPSTLSATLPPFSHSHH